jgi:hypothetical protein
MMTFIRDDAPFTLGWYKCGCRFIQGEIEQFQVEALPKHCAFLWLKNEPISKVQLGGQQL